MLKRGTAAFVFACAGFATACASESPSDSATATTTTSVASTAEASAYPATYRDLNLPVLPGGVVTSAGRQSTSLRDGLSIRLTTSQSVAEVRAFYRDAMTALGWTPAAPGSGAAALNLPLANVIFTRDQLTFQATITAGDAGSLVSLTVLER
jgi:hypothetical protein